MAEKEIFLLKTSKLLTSHLRSVSVCCCQLMRGIYSHAHTALTAAILRTEPPLESVGCSMMTLKGKLIQIGFISSL